MSTTDVIVITCSGQCPRHSHSESAADIRLRGLGRTAGCCDCLHRYGPHRSRLYWIWFDPVTCKHSTLFIRTGIERYLHSALSSIELIILCIIYDVYYYCWQPSAVFDSLPPVFGSCRWLNLTSYKTDYTKAEIESSSSQVQVGPYPHLSFFFF